MSAPAPLRHYFVAADAYNATTRPGRTCARAGCARPERDPVHLEPGDRAACDAAIDAATAGHNATDGGALLRERAEKRHAARWTFGTATTSADAGETVTIDLGRGSPPDAG